VKPPFAEDRSGSVAPVRHHGEPTPASGPSAHGRWHPLNVGFPDCGAERSTPSPVGSALNPVVATVGFRV